MLFSNAGISGVIRPVTDYPEDIFDAVVAVNLKGSFLACKHALPSARRRQHHHDVERGRCDQRSRHLGLAASKHGLIGLMRTVAKEAASRRIRVNVVAPGPIDNDFQRNVESGLSQALGTDAGKFLDSVDPARPSYQAGGGGRDGPVPRLRQERDDDLAHVRHRRRPERLTALPRPAVQKHQGVSRINRGRWRAVCSLA